MDMRKLIWVVIAITMFDCGGDEFKPSDEERCRVGRYVYGKDSGSDVSYNITYVENFINRVDVAIDQVFMGDTWVTNDTYKHIYRNDSLYIKDFKTFTEGEIFLTALLSQKIQEVVTTIPDNGGTYRFRFDYSTTQQIAVTLDKLEGSTAVFDSRAVYFMDEGGDVSRMEIFRNEAIHGQDPDNYTHRDKAFKYDIAQNPLKDLVIAHFFKAELPDVTFFSFHNRLEETYDGATRKFEYVYGTDPMPKEITTPDGVKLRFEYPNCTN